MRITTCNSGSGIASWYRSKLPPQKLSAQERKAISRQLVKKFGAKQAANGGRLTAEQREDLHVQLQE